MCLWVCDQLDHLRGWGSGEGVWSPGLPLKTLKGAQVVRTLCTKLGVLFSLYKYCNKCENIESRLIAWLIWRSCCLSFKMV